MDECSSRKAAGALSFSRKASSGLVPRNSADKGDRNTQVCSRVGCGSQMNFSLSNQTGCSGKAKTTRHPFGLSNISKKVVASSSKTPLAPGGPRKTNSDLQKRLPSHQGADMESKPVIVSDNSRVKPNNTAPLRNNVSGEASSSSSTPQSSQGKKTLRRTESIGPSASSAFKQGSNGIRNGASTSKCKNLKNFKCNSTNDVVSSGCSSSASSSDLNLDGNKVMSRKRIGEAEGSLSTRGKKINSPPLDDRRNDRSVGGISIASSRRTRNSIFTRDNDHTSVGIRRSAARARLNEQEDRNRLRQTDSSNAPRRQVNSNESLASFDPGFGSSFLNMENVGHYNLNGVAEMLLALDGIEQDEEPNYEQMLGLETNLLLDGLGFHDQHRDMRLDIDNMSYEELLALEERMGTVSTALTEEALEKCLKKGIYNKATPTGEENVVGESDDIKCCICQEEYDVGNKVGRLRCEHQYHVECIQKWLQLKNWCPICKASAVPSSSS